MIIREPDRGPWGSESSGTAAGVKVRRIAPDTDIESTQVARLERQGYECRPGRERLEGGEHTEAFVIILGSEDLGHGDSPAEAWADAIRTLEPS